MNELEVECLASQLPENITIDLGDVVKNQSMHVSELKLPVGIKAVKHGTLNPVVVAVTLPKAEEEEVVAPVVVAPEKGKAKPKKTEKQNKK
jgi:large subunit ribosomal protein L25